MENVLKNPWVWGGGLIAGLFLILTRGGGQSSSANAAVMLESQRIASQQDTALGLAQAQLQAQVAAIRGGIQAEHEQTARLQTATIGEATQAAIQARMHERSMAAQLEASTRQGVVDLARADIAYRAATNPRLLEIQAQVESHRIDVQANTQVAQARIAGEVQEYIARKGKPGETSGIIGAIGGVVEGIVGLFA
jgi:hypothetical protein